MLRSQIYGSNNTRKQKREGSENGGEEQAISLYHWSDTELLAGLGGITGA